STDPSTYLGLSLLAENISGKINIGGLLNPELGETFLAFYADSEELGITHYFAQSYGDSGASQPKISFRLNQDDVTQTLFETE
ncbi:MAG: hypothetical protein VSS52_005255, partial [Thiotrichaceae bacterium]|nr:hypothetical protein [Thiotrichaceae bacterium]